MFVKSQFWSQRFIKGFGSTIWFKMVFQKRRLCNVMAKNLNNCPFSSLPRLTQGWSMFCCIVTVLVPIFITGFGSVYDLEGFCKKRRLFNKMAKNNNWYIHRAWDKSIKRVNTCFVANSTQHLHNWIYAAASTQAERWKNNRCGIVCPALCTNDMSEKICLYINHISTETFIGE